MQMNMTLANPQLESDNSYFAFDDSYIGLFITLDFGRKGVWIWNVQNVFWKTSLCIQECKNVNDSNMVKIFLERQLRTNQRIFCNSKRNICSMKSVPFVHCIWRARKHTIKVQFVHFEHFDFRHALFGQRTMYHENTPPGCPTWRTHNGSHTSSICTRENILCFDAIRKKFEEDTKLLEEI